MPIVFEFQQFRSPREGQERFAASLQLARERGQDSRPVLDWLEQADIRGPGLVFDLAAIEQRMRWLGRVAAEFSASPLVAVKSCSETVFLELARRHLAGFDVSNVAEYSRLPVDLAGRLVSVTSPAMVDAPEAFLGRGNQLVVTVDSRLQLERHLAREGQSDYILRIRSSDLLEGRRPLDPAYYPGSRFGFSPDEVGQLLQDSAVRKKPPAGFHVHHGSEKNSAATYKILIEGMAQLASLLDAPPRYINLGGGWHRLAASAIREVLLSARSHFPAPCVLLFEPGRWYGEGAGYAVGSIVNIARTGKIVRCTLDLSGKSHLHWSMPTLLHTFDERYSEGGAVQIFGPSCYESDFVGKFYLPCAGDVIRDAGLDFGRRLVFGNVSTYSLEWNTSFNGVPAANVHWCRL